MVHSYSVLPPKELLDFVFDMPSIGISRRRTEISTGSISVTKAAELDRNGNTNIPFIYIYSLVPVLCHVLKLNLHFLVCEAMRRGSPVFLQTRSTCMYFWWCSLMDDFLNGLKRGTPVVTNFWCYWPQWYDRQNYDDFVKLIGLNYVPEHLKVRAIGSSKHLVTKETQSIGGWKCCLWQGRDLWLEPTVKPWSFHSAGWLRRWLNRLVDVWYWKNWSMNYTTFWHDIYK